MKWCAGVCLLYLSVSGEHSPPSNPDSRTTSKGIFRLLCSSRAHYCIHKSLLLVRVLSQTNPNYALTPYFIKMHFHINHLPPTPWSPDWSQMYFTTTIINIWRRADKLWNFSFCNFCILLLLRITFDCLLCTLFTNILNFDTHTKQNVKL
jgi:hypothetical protein